MERRSALTPATSFPLLARSESGEVDPTALDSEVTPQIASEGMFFEELDPKTVPGAMNDRSAD